MMTRRRKKMMRRTRMSRILLVLAVDLLKVSQRRRIQRKGRKMKISPRKRIRTLIMRSHQRRRHLDL